MEESGRYFAQFHMLSPLQQSHYNAAINLSVRPEREGTVTDP